MEEKLQAKNIRIVLFFSHLLECNSVKLANSLIDELPELGQPNIFNIPEEAPNEIKNQMPKIIFNNKKEINITVTNISIDISIDNDNIEFIKNIVNKMYKALNENSIKVQEIGVVSQYLYFDINFEKIKKIYYKDEEVISCDLFNMSWYKKQNDINIWKTLKIDEKNNLKNLTLSIDINNRGINKIIDIDYISEFLSNQNTQVNNFREDLEKKIGD